MIIAQVEGSGTAATEPIASTRSASGPSATPGLAGLLSFNDRELQRMISDACTETEWGQDVEIGDHSSR